MSRTILEIESLYKTYGEKENAAEALRGISFQVYQGEFLGIMGSSGSGKTTLLNILAALDKPTQGKIYLKGSDLGGLREKEISAFRRENLGFVFQDFNLLDTFSLKDNIFLPLVLEGKHYREMKQKADPIVKKLGISNLLEKYPYEVSGGQKQRTAIARALITNPRILLADEPTGALDSKAATNLLKQLREINQTGQTILMVTHSNVAASYADRVMFIKDGEVFHQIYRGDMTRSALLDKICDAVTVLMRGGEDSES